MSVLDLTERERELVAFALHFVNLNDDQNDPPVEWSESEAADLAERFEEMSAADCVEVVEGVRAEVLAQAIVRMSEAAEQLTKAGLSRRAILVLLRDLTGLGLSQIDTVLDALGDLRDTYVTEEAT